MRFNRPALTAQIGALFHRGEQPMLLRTLYVEDAGGAPAGGSSSSPPAPSGTPAASAPIAGAPAAGAPAADGKPADTGAPAPGADVIVKPPADAEPPAKPTVDEQRAYLATKGSKAEDLAKLSEADLQKQFDTAKAAEPKLGEVKPEDIKIAVPDGFTVDQKVLGEFQGLMADAKLTPQERAQKLMDMHVSALKAAAEAPQQAWTELNTKWQGEIKADKELGGANFDTMRSTIAKAITEVGGPEADAIFESFKLTGAANNPAIVRLIYRFAKAYSEGGPQSGNAPGAVKDRSLSTSIQAMYPSAANGNKEPAKAA